jgi:hypothetical protein
LGKWMSRFFCFSVFKVFSCCINEIKHKKKIEG